MFQKFAQAMRPERRNDPELMDEPGLPVDEVAHAYRVLRRINAMLGNNRSLDIEIRRFWTARAVQADSSSPFVLLDVGSGSGDVPQRLAEWLDRAEPGLPVVPIALDRDPTAVDLMRASFPSLRPILGDALRLPFPDRSVDLVTAVKFAHHFEGRALSKLVAEMARVSRGRVVVLDIERSWLAYWGFILWSRLFTTSRLVRFDGPLSVLRGFTRQELLDLASAIPGYRWTVRPYIGFQLALVGERAQVDEIRKCSNP